MTSVLAGGAFVLLTGLWFLVIWRSSQIEGRLRGQAESARSIEMARRLATAQIEPHFLFSTWASAQHWVQTGHARAAPLLAALTGYLRATLPLFQHAELPAADELLAVQRYLEVMQARMGERLRWQIDVSDDARRARLPPGLLLTLVENAVVHGVEPKLVGGHVALRGRVEGSRVTFRVDDDGARLPAELKDGIGLANIRERLALAHGGNAGLTLQARADGGCRPQLQLPWTTT
ncbi:MAG: histidine kinase [Pseudomonadota bacterium]|nr:histidine kinase [Pseudomonadota bacterium]